MQISVFKSGFFSAPEILVFQMQCKSSGFLPNTGVEFLETFKPCL